jgi:hypothetical protein
LFDQPFRPKLHMTEADFHIITRNGSLCDSEGGLGVREFELVMRDQASGMHVSVWDGGNRTHAVRVRL